MGGRTREVECDQSCPPVYIDEGMELLAKVLKSSEFHTILERTKKRWTTYCRKKICPSVGAAIGAALGYAAYVEILVTFIVVLPYVLLVTKEDRSVGNIISVVK